jgi:hypothetical protein
MGVQFMIRRAFFCLVILAGASTPVFADDSGMPVWKVVGQWQIRVDPSVGNGCFMLASYERGDVLRLGFNRTDRYGYMLLGNDDWKSLVVGNAYPITVQFGSNTPWTVNARVIEVGGGPFIAFKFTSSDMLQEFSDSDGVRVTYQERPVVNLALTGSKAAVAELVNCQDYVDKNISTKISPSQSDPFASGANTSSDPFSH